MTVGRKIITVTIPERDIQNRMERLKMKVADIILEQLGGNKFVVTMRFFKYTPMKLNTKTFEFSKEKIKEIKTVEGVYCDMLQETFTEVTGMYTRLF